MYTSTRCPMVVELLDTSPSLDSVKAHLRITWLKVDRDNIRTLVDGFTKRRELLGIHTEILEPRDDASLLLVCDYYPSAVEAE